MSERVWYRSIYWRIAIGFIVFLAVMLAAQGGLFLWIVARADGALPAHSLIEFANVVASDLGNEIEQAPGVDIGRYIRDHYGQMSRRVFVVMPDGRFFASHAVARSAAVVDRAKEWLAKGAPAEVETIPFRFGRLIAFSRLFVNGVAVGTVAVEPGGPSARLIREIVPTMLLMVGVLMLGGTALAALLIFRPVNRRLKGLEEAARRLGAGDLTTRAPVGGGDETTAVAKAFNRMADDLATRAAQLQAYDRARRQLFADVSHELMTPLTAIRGYVETLALPDLKADENTRRRYLREGDRGAPRRDDLGEEPAGRGNGLRDQAAAIVGATDDRQAPRRRRPIAWREGHGPGSARQGDAAWSPDYCSRLNARRRRASSCFRWSGVSTLKISVLTAFNTAIRCSFKFFLSWMSIFPACCHPWRAVRSFSATALSSGWCALKMPMICCRCSGVSLRPRSSRTMGR
jgi:HAMP domain-containing protein